MISRFFSLEEYTRSEYADRNGIDNTPPEDALNNLMVLSRRMDMVRIILAVPIYITSGYRCPSVNTAIGGRWNSQHVLGQAADFVAPAYGSAKQVAQTIERFADAIQFDQLICESYWVHMSISETPRLDILTAHFSKDGTTYTRGIA